MGNDIKYIELSKLLSCAPRNGLYKGKEFQGSGHRWIKMSEIYGNSFFRDQDTELLEVNESEIDRFSCVQGDLLFGRTSLILEGVGDCLLVENITDKPIFESNLFRLRFDFSKACPRFYFYYFQSQLGKQLIQKIAKQTAAASITAADLIDQAVPYFNVDLEKKISNLIYEFDKKIQLNRQTNQTLEKMAQALFKSWFVDFDPVIDNALAAGKPIPDELQERAERRQEQIAKADHKPLPYDVRCLFPDGFELSEELGWVPVGWSASRLDGILELAYGKALKKGDRVSGEVPVYGSGGVNGYHNRAIVSGPGIVVGRKGTVGSLYWENESFYPIDTVFFVKPKEHISLNYCFLLLQTLGLEKMNTDAAVPGLNRNNAYRLEFVLPTMELLGKFSDIVESFREKTVEFEDQSRLLSRLRDTLLPKLISGELRLPSTESPDTKLQSINEAS